MDWSLFSIVVLAVLFGLFLLWYLIKYRRLDSGLVLLALYFLVSFLGIPAYLQNPTEWRISLFPYVFFFLMSLFFFTPFLRLDCKRVGVRLKDSYIIRFFAIVFFISSLITTYLYLPIARDNILSGEWLAARNAVYSDEKEFFSSNLIRLLANFYTHIQVVGTVITFFYLSDSKVGIIKKSLLVFAIIIPPLLIAITVAARDKMFELVMLWVVSYFVFYNKFSKRVRHLIVYGGLSLLAIIALLLIGITTSRFGDESDSSLLYYFSSSMMRFNYGIVDSIKNYAGGWFFLGRIYLFFFDFPVYNFDSYLGTHIGSGFFTYLGAWYMDFGPVGTLLVAILFYALMNKLIDSIKERPTIAKVSLYVFFLMYLIRGVFVHPAGIAFEWLIQMVIFVLLSLRVKSY